MKKLSLKTMASSMMVLALMVITSTLLSSDNIAMAAQEIKIHSSDYGYGKYSISARVVGYDGVYDEDTVVFYYLPIDASYSINPITGEYEVKIVSAGDDVASADIYLENTLLGTLTHAEFANGKVSFSLAGKPSGKYTVMIVAKDAAGNMIHVPFTLTIEYNAAVVPDAGAPDTGGLFQNLNISREDYLTTGLIMFFVLGVVGFGIVARGRRDNSKKRRH